MKHPSGNVCGSGIGRIACPKKRTAKNRQIRSVRNREKSFRNNLGVGLQGGAESRRAPAGERQAEAPNAQPGSSILHGRKSSMTRVAPTHSAAEAGRLPLLYCPCRGGH